MLILRYFQCSFYAMTDVVFTPFSLKVLRLASLARPIPSIKSERAWLSPLAHLGKRNQLGISPARRSILTSLRKASLREDRIAFLLPSKELASVHELLQHILANRFIAPFALRKQRSGPRHRQQSSRFLPAYVCDCPSPTSARRSPEPHRAGPRARVRTRIACI